MTDASLSFHSVVEDLCQVPRYGDGLNNTSNTSMTFQSVPEEILADGSPLRRWRGSVSSCGSIPRAVAEEYDEDFEDYSGSEDAVHDNQGLDKATPGSQWKLSRPAALLSLKVETPVGINAARFSSAEQEETSPNLEQSWDYSPGWSDVLGEQSPQAQDLVKAPNKKNGKHLLALDTQELDDSSEQSGSATWSWGSGGAMRHKPSQTRISKDTGVTFGGRDYRLAPEDIELDDGGLAGEASRLGAGSCGVVFRGRIRSTGAFVAVKTIPVDDRAKRQQLLNEIRSLVQAEGCPNLVQWYAGFVSQDTGKVNIVLEFMDRGSLADLSAKLRGKGVPLSHLSCIAAQIVGGLNHLHSRRILHRDVKPENVLHNAKGEVKLTDFGIAKDLAATIAIASTFIGTATYMAPERCMGEEYSLASDIWSFGMVIFELATGRYPFYDEMSSFPALVNCLCDRPEPRLDSSKFPATCCDFIAHCLIRDKMRRADTAWLSGHSFVAARASAASFARDQLAQWLNTLQA